jgi:hypothetical protein
MQIPLKHASYMLGAFLSGKIFLYGNQTRFKCDHARTLQAPLIYLYRAYAIKNTYGPGS